VPEQVGQPEFPLQDVVLSGMAKVSPTCRVTAWEIPRPAGESAGLRMTPRGFKLHHYRGHKQLTVFEAAR